MAQLQPLFFRVFLIVCIAWNRLRIDGSRCWAGPLQRRDLAGPLGDSWKDPANLRLLQNVAWHVSTGKQLVFY